MHHGEISKNIARGLKELQGRIKKAEIPPSKLDETLNIATWNIREFGRKPRKEASLHYIAEIMGQFDLIAVVELREDLHQLAKVMGYLGPYWEVVYSDFIVDAGGNRERIGYVFDKRAVTFTGLASNIQPPRTKEGQEYVPEISWWRPPYMGSFRAGNFDFVLLAAHIRWGDSQKNRLPELSLLADWVSKKVKQKVVDDKDIIVVGDFNIPDVQSDLYKAITRRGLLMPDGLMGVTGSDLAKGKRYDQILHLPATAHAFMNKGGVLDFYQSDHAPLYPHESITKSDFTYEVSDHLPLWVQINTDNDGELLDQILNPKHER